MLIKRLGFYLLFCLFCCSNIYAQTQGENSKGLSYRTYRFSIPTSKGVMDFNVHSKAEHKEFVQELKIFAQDKFPQVVNYFGYALKDTVNIIIEEDEPESNGMATVFPSNLIYLYTMPPIGSGYLTSSNNYYQKLFLHEFIHVLHMERTEGVIGGLETIFGTIARLAPALTPRWFAEGIAMWGEDHFSDEGRLKNKYLLKEIASYVNREGHCQNISCLDQPDIYPYGSLAYWVGGHFLKFLENKKSGTISCLIRSNSSNLPFFLNGVFKECSGMDVEDAFDMYKQSLPPASEFIYAKEKGIHFDGDNLYYFKNIDRRDYFIKKELKTGSQRKTVVNARVKSIQDSTSQMRLITSDNLSPNLKHVISELNSQGELTSVVKDVQYSFNIDGDEISLKFEKFRWQIYVNSKKIVGLEKNATLMRPYVLFKKLNFFSYSNDSFQIASFNPKTGVFNRITQVGQTLNLIGLCDGEGAIYTKDQDYIFYDGEALFELKPKLAKYNNLSYIAKKGAKVLLLRDKLSYYKGSCLDIFHKSRFEPRLKKNRKLPAVEEEEYSALQYLTPNYWYALYSNTAEGLGYFQVSTSVSDPLQRHTVGLSLEYYSSLDSYGGDFNYLYDFDMAKVSLGYTKTFQQDVANTSKELFDETFFASINTDFEFYEYGLDLNAGASQQNYQDIFSSDKLTNISTALSFYKYPKYEYQFFNTFSFNVLARKHKSDSGYEYDSYHAVGGINFDLYKDFILSSKATWAKLDKDTFSNGILYGGGEHSTNHLFHGLEYSDVFGNSIQTTRLQLEFPLLRTAKGWGLIPLYFKNITGIVGQDYIKSDFIYFDGVTYRDVSAESIFYGVGINTMIFYRAPIKFDILKTDTKLSNGKSKKASVFSTSTTYYF